MKRISINIVRGFVILSMLTLAGGLAVSALSSFVRAQDAPAAECGSGPNVICPAEGDPSAQYIASVTAVPDGVVILLTDDGLSKARECGGASEIAAMTEVLYDTIPADQKAEFQLDWASQTLADEIYGHAFLNELSGGLGGLSDIHERSNPVNVEFADYGGPGEMTDEASAEQKTFRVLGAIQRSTC